MGAATQHPADPVERIAFEAVAERLLLHPAADLVQGGEAGAGDGGRVVDHRRVGQPRVEGCRVYRPCGLARVAPSLSYVVEVKRLGVDETAFLAGNHRHPTPVGTGLVDVVAGRLLDAVNGRSGAVLARQVDVAALDPFRGRLLWNGFARMNEAGDIERMLQVVPKIINVFESHANAYQR